MRRVVSGVQGIGDAAVLSKFVLHETGASETQLQNIEHRIGSALPEDYRAFLKLSNGAAAIRSDAGTLLSYRIQWNGQPWARHFETGDLDNLESADHTAKLKLAVTHDSSYAIIRDYIPDDLIPIGHDNGGNAIVIGVKGVRRGKIFLWIADYATCENRTAPSYDNVGFIAESFSQFLECLTFEE